MGKVLLFWMSFPGSDIDYVTWNEFRDMMAGWVMVCLLLTTAAIVGLYWNSARRKKIHTPADLFKPYTPMRWLWLAFVPVVLVFIVYAVEYRKLFSGAQVSYMSGAVAVGLWAGFLTLLLAYLLMLIPQITPAKFRYRPLWLFYRKKGVR